MRVTLHLWRQDGPEARGRFVRYEAEDVSSHMSFLEMLDVLNEGLIEKGEEPVAFEGGTYRGRCTSSRRRSRNTPIR